MSTWSVDQCHARNVQAGERGMTLSDALQRGTEAVDELGMSTRFTDYGNGADPGAWNCELLDRRGRVVAAGSGKGDRASATVGALFEALEHHFTGPAGIRPEHTTFRSAHGRARTLLADDVISGPLLDAPDAALACRPYRSATGELADVPLFLPCQDYLEAPGLTERIGDSYDYSTLNRYAFSSGYAAGTSYAEAVVHGLNETIERDALSLFLVHTFLRSEPIRPNVLDPGTLPADLAGLLTLAMDRTRRPVRLLEITSDLGVPAILAYLPPVGQRAARVRGCGASLSRHHAVQRALTELLQLDAATRHVAAFPEHGEQLENHPRLRACYLMHLDPFLQDATPIPYRETTASATPEEHLRRLIDVLSQRSFVPYVRELHISARGVTVVSTFVPGLERFMVVTDGRPVVPGPRGMAAIRSARVGGHA